jgi:diguanylate cyclase (GGDEF)-like protein
MLVMIYSARQNIHQQLQVHAQDTATSLGFSISQAALAKDTVQVSSMIDVIFDRGYYRSIIYRDLEHEEIIRREQPIFVEDVPRWFTHWLMLPEPTGSSAVSSGWFQLGELTVTSHPGFAYRDLWRSFKDQLWLYSVTIVLCYGLLGIGLKMILHPLKEVEKQAEAICRREFSVQNTLPNIPELRSVALAMNRMVEKVKVMFGHQVELNNRLHQQLRTDAITGLSNRHDFDERLIAYTRSERTANNGLLMLMQVGDLQLINCNIGRQEGDDYLVTVSTCLLHYLQGFHDAICSRHSGADFAIFIPAINEIEGRELMGQLYGGLQSIEWSGEKIQSIYVGAVYIANINEQVTERKVNLLAAADAALNEARNERLSGCCWQLLSQLSQQTIFNNKQWLDLISTALSQQALTFHYQPVWQVIDRQKKLIFNEVLTHLTLNGDDYAASVFMPIAMRLQVMPLFDTRMLEALLGRSLELPDKLCINISTASLDDEQFITALEVRLKSQTALASRLVFELAANSLSVTEHRVRGFAKMIKKYGSQLSLHHFGRGTAEFAFMQSLSLDYLKIDRCFIQNIVEDKDSQFFVRSLVAIAKSCDVMVLAEGVETEVQWDQLIQLGIQGGQGYWLGRPQADPVIY